MIEIKINIEKLLLISRVFNSEFESKKSARLPREKADLSLAKFVYKKLGKKVISRMDKPKHKEFKMSFQYYEAHSIQQTISNNLWSYNKLHFEFAVLSLLNDELQQKLTQNV